MCEMRDQSVADGLQNLHQHQQQYDRHEHHIVLEALITITNRQVAQPCVTPLRVTRYSSHHRKTADTRHCVPIFPTIRRKTATSFSVCVYRYPSAPCNAGF